MPENQGVSLINPSFRPLSGNEERAKDRRTGGRSLSFPRATVDAGTGPLNSGTKMSGRIIVAIARFLSSRCGYAISVSIPRLSTNEANSESNSRSVLYGLIDVGQRKRILSVEPDAFRLATDCGPPRLSLPVSRRKSCLGPRLNGGGHRDLHEQRRDEGSLAAVQAGLQLVHEHLSNSKASATRHGSRERLHGERIQSI